MIVTASSEWLKKQRCPKCGGPIIALRAEIHSGDVAGERIEYGMVQLACACGHRWSKIPE